MPRTMFVALLSAGALALWLLALPVFESNGSKPRSRPASNDGHDLNMSAHAPQQRMASALSHREDRSSAAAQLQRSSALHGSEEPPRDRSPANADNASATSALDTPNAYALDAKLDSSGFHKGVAQVTAADPSREPNERGSSLPEAQADPGVATEAGAGRSQLEREWHAQPHSPARSREVQTYLQETANALSLPADVVRSADCGSSVCRVRLKFGSAEQAAQFEQAAQNPGLRYEVKSTAAQALPEAVLQQLQQAAGPTPSTNPSAAPQQPIASAVPPPNIPPFELEVMLETARDTTESTLAEQPAL